VKLFFAAIMAVFALFAVHAEASTIPQWAINELIEKHSQSPLDREKIGNGVTHFVYLYPTDRPFREDYLQAVQYSATRLRDWYSQELGGYAPTLPAPPAELVLTIQLDNPSSFYGTNNPGGSEYLIFWNNVLNEALPKAGAQFNDPGNAWIFFVDAPAGCGQLSGGGISGIAVMSHNDLRGLIGDVFLECNGFPNGNLTFTPERWIGGQGHELGHAYGLRHPPGCDEGLSSCDAGALMWTGFYTGFPNSTYLRVDDIASLISGSYVAPTGGSSLNYSYTYWNPSEAGWGYNLQHQGDLLYGTWYSYADDGQVMFLTVEATAQSLDSFAGPIYRATGTPFEQINGSQAFTSVTQVGTAQLSFSADRSLTLSYTVNGVAQVKTLERFVFGTTAPNCIGTTSSRENATNYSDLWWNSSEPGWGLTLAHQGDVIFALWYTYGSAGRDQWVSASSLVRQPDGSYQGELQRPASGTPLAQIVGPATTFPVPTVGTAILRFMNGEQGTFEYTLDGVAQTKSIRRFVVVGEEQAKPLCIQ